MLTASRFLASDKDGALPRFCDYASYSPEVSGRCGPGRP
jgi:hypothetical protein